MDVPKYLEHSQYKQKAVYNFRGRGRFEELRRSRHLEHLVCIPISFNYIV